MKRHWPEADFSETDEKARVAVSSRGLASATAEGLRTTPARDTDMTEGEAIVLAVVLAETAGGDVVTIWTAAGDVEAAEVVDGSRLVGLEAAAVVDAGAVAELSPKVND